MKSIVTLCRDCCFAQYKNDKQVGCKLGRLAAFQARGTVIRHFNKKAEFDIGGLVKEDENFYIVEGFCNACRNKDWPLYNDPDNAEKIRDIIAIPYNMVIGLSDGNSTYELEKSLQAVLAQKIKPKKVVVIGWTDNPTYVVQTIRSMLDGHTLWRFVQRVDAVPDNKIEAMINEGVDKASHKGFYVYFNSDFDIPHDFSERLDWLFNYYMLKFIALEPYDDRHNGLVCFCPIHTQAGGFGKISLIPKIQARLEEDECPQMVYKINEVFSLYDAQLSYPTTITLNS